MYATWGDLMGQEPAWGERDLLFATAMMTRNLAAWLVLSGAMSADELAAIVKITSDQLQKEGDKGGARRALAGVFGEKFTEQTRHLEALLRASSKTDSAQ